jgi:hypothetical protein
MQGIQIQRRRSQGQGATERARVQSSVAVASGMLALPAWESFQEEDRRRLVRALLQAARRQVERAGPADRLLRK